ncbi:NAD(P)/FAD-dependent oxidoreductase [Rhodobiaceae bacterium]|nr:NAD(P)/FAD-dependent oxidoreductase [Rhodobiaceae bacterium]
MNSNNNTVYDSIILGAGISGIGMAVNLLKADISSFLVLEKKGAVGGTWRDNTYPGLCCDVASHFYAFSFELNPNWSKKYPEQTEILDYLEMVTEKYKIKPHIKFNTEVVKAEFDSKESLWDVFISDGNIYKTKTLVSGLGQLNKPTKPLFEGSDKFVGPSFHSAEWDHSCDLKGKKVGVIGTGPSAVGFIPKIAENVEELIIFQRTPNWILPKPDRKFNNIEKWLLKNMPFFGKIYRYYEYLMSERLYFAFFVKQNKISSMFERIISNLTTGFKINNMSSMYQQGQKMLLDAQISDELLRKKLTPNYPVGCKRVIPTNDFFPTLERENVFLETKSISRFNEDSIVTDDGKKNNVDVIIYGTGFETNVFISPVKIIGQDNIDLDDVWINGAEAYKGVMVSEFPNFFMCYGPNTNTGHVSIIFMIENQIKFIIKSLKLIKRKNLKHIDVKQRAMNDYNLAIQKKLSTTVWAASCQSWYKTSEGKILNNFPGFGFEYYLMMSNYKYNDIKMKT